MRVVRRLVARRRRPVAAVLAGLAVACVLTAVRAPDGVEVLAAARDIAGGRLAAADVMVVRLPPDAVPAGAYAPGAPVTGRVISGPLRRGEPLTDARLLGPGMFRQALARQASGHQASGDQASGVPTGGVAVPAGQAASAAEGAAPAAERTATEQTAEQTAGQPAVGHEAATAEPEMVATPVRIADPDAARLLSPGDVVDVLAAFEDGPFEARTVARQVRVIARPPGRTDGGALLVLATTPGQAAQLAQAQAQGRLSVTIHPR